MSISIHDDHATLCNDCEEKIMTTEEKYECAVFVLRKIAEWDSEWHSMSAEESLRCCQNMARTFLRYKDVTNEGNVITGYPWGSEDGELDPVGERMQYMESEWENDEE